MNLFDIKTMCMHIVYATWKSQSPPPPSPPTLPLHSLAKTWQVSLLAASQI